MDRRKEKKSNQKPKELRGKKYIEYICSLYNDSYDDREEDSRIGGETGNRGKRLIIDRWRRLERRGRKKR